MGPRLLRSPLFWPLAALGLLLLFNILLTPNFARLEVRDGRLFGATVDILKNGSMVMLLATGMTLVIATGGIDLSVGSVMSVAGAAAALLMTERGASPLAASAAALAAAAAIGALNGAVITFAGLQPIVMTLSVLVAGRGVAQALTHDQKVRLEIPAFEYLGNGSLLGLPVPVFIAGAMAALALAACRKTSLGMYVEAIGGNPRAARLCGLPVHAVRVAVYAFCGLLAGAAGLVATAIIKEADVANCGLYLELDAILAVVLGGTSLSGGRPRVGGALVGALFMQTLTTMLQMRGVVTEHTLLIKAVVALGVCALQSPLPGRLLRRLAPREAAG